MAVKLKVGAKNDSFWTKLLHFVLVVFLCCVVLVGIVFGIEYNHYEGIVDHRLAQGPLFASTAQIYAAAQEVRPGQQLSTTAIAALLRRAGYNQNPQLGNFQLRGDSILIKPGPQSYLAADGATINTANGSVQNIVAENGVALGTYKLEPQLITALSEDKNRSKRRIVTYDQIPPRLVQAALAIEDRRFFEHNGLNYGRLLKCGEQDMLSHRASCGGSTITQQLAKNFFLSSEKTISRKVAEMMITFQLERRFNKQ
ncbi:MAG: transglycosylase domain-containing protein, partial [Bryocella sp.]